MRRAWWLLVLGLSACGDRGPKPVSPEAAALLQKHRDPRTWEVLEPTEEAGWPRRVRDPRTGIVFVLVPPGEFTMGGRLDMEQPLHSVRISRAFYMAETELTAAQWRRHVEEFGGDPTVPVGDVPGDQPATGISWDDGVRYCDVYRYRLPTEAEWEYACRGGVAEEGAFWNDPVALDQHSWSGVNAKGKPQPVRTAKPNGFGLYDMLGGAWEWCADYFGKGYPVPDPSVLTVDPTGVENADGRCLRGGSWFTLPPARPADRSGALPETRLEYNGIRPVVSLP